VLKKAGIVVATSAAALLAVSPLAFAGDYSDHDNHHHSHHSRGCDQDTTARASSDRRGDGDGLINVSRNAVQVPIQACNNNILNNIGVGVLGRGRANGGNNG
jgi:hypothetical protein